MTSGTFTKVWSSLGLDDKTANEMRHALCSRKVVLKNHVIPGGLSMGNFTKIPGIYNIENCTSLCCGEKLCEMAMLLNGVCFVGSCWNKEKCRPMRLTSKAGIRSHLGFKIGFENTNTLKGMITWTFLGELKVTKNLVKYQGPVFI